MYWKLIFKNTIFLLYGANLDVFGANLTSWSDLCVCLWGQALCVMAAGCPRLYLYVSPLHLSSPSICPRSTQKPLISCPISILLTHLSPALYCHLLLLGVYLQFSGVFVWFFFIECSFGYASLSNWDVKFWSSNWVRLAPKWDKSGTF